MQVSNKLSVFILGAALLAVVAAGLASYKTIFSDRAGTAAAPSSVDRERLKRPNMVAALGRIEPRGGIINLGAGFAPDRVDTLFVDRGDLVKRDEVLGYLAGHAEQMAQRDMLVAQLYETKARLDAENALNLVRVRAAELNRRRILEVFPFEIAAQEATIASLEAKNASKKDIQPARERLSELQQRFEIDRIDADVQVDLARAARDRAKTEFPIESLNHQIAMSEARAKRLTLYAPCDCQVLNVRIKAGEEVGAGPILILGDTTRMRAVAEVYETDIAQVRMGQPATVSSRALSKPISGKVVRVGSMIFKNDVLNVDPAARADARVVEVWIDLNDSEPLERLTNLTVDVMINTSSAGEQAAR